jgi:hypothetical protein
MARLLGVSLRTVSRLEGDPKTAELPRSIAEIRRLLNALAEIMRREHVSTWLDEPTEGFSGLKPIEVIERGELDRIWAMIFRVGSGQPV